MTDRPVRVRIGPSPTGEPHVGTAYIALFNLAFARKHGGKFVLRIEDTDQERSRPEWEAQIVAGLKWLGLEWDEGPDKGGPYGPYRQSERQQIHREHAELLVAKGGAYRCFCTKERLDELREKQRIEKQTQGYDRLCRELSAEEVQAKRDAGIPHVIRMKMPIGGTTVFKDGLRGDVEIDNAQVDDQVLLKADGFPTYHLANVVDDHLMEITHVIRAEEWISSTPKHVVLYASFGWEAPKFFHMPLLRNADKSKISKRKNPVSILDYRQRGYTPQAVRNYLSQLGWSMPDGREVFSLQEFIENFDFERISLGGPIFDLKKLSDLNGRYYREKLNDDELTDLFARELFSREYLRRIVPLIRERIDKAEDFVPATEYFFRGDVTYPAADLKPKKREWKELNEVLEEYAAELDTQVDFSAAALEAFSRGFADKKQWKTGDLFSPIRTAVSGRAGTPPLFDVMSVLGRALVRRRLRAAVEMAKKEASDEAKAKQKAESDAKKAEADAKKKADAEAKKSEAGAKQSGESDAK